MEIYTIVVATPTGLSLLGGLFGSIGFKTTETMENKRKSITGQFIGSI